MRRNVRKTLVPIRLSEPKILMGAEFKLVVANFAFGFLAIALLHVWQYALVVGVLHGVLILATKADHRSREIYLEYVKQAESYTPWPSGQQLRCQQRPIGFGRNQQM